MRTPPLPSPVGPLASMTSPGQHQHQHQHQCRRLSCSQPEDSLYQQDYQQDDLHQSQQYQQQESQGSSILVSNLTQSAPRPSRDTNITPRPFSCHSEFATCGTIRNNSNDAAASDLNLTDAGPHQSSRNSKKPSGIVLEELRKRMGETIMNQQQQHLQQQQQTAQPYYAQESVSTDSGFTDSDTNMTPNTSDEKVAQLTQPSAPRSPSSRSTRPPTLPQRSLVTPPSPFDTRSNRAIAEQDGHLASSAAMNLSTNAANTANSNGLGFHGQQHQPHQPYLHSPRGIKPKRRSIRHPYTADTLKRMNEMPAASITAAPADFLPPGTAPITDSSPYPTPNLYDITLALNADPGLDGWWSNVVPILKTHYGAERLTLAVPGDATDLENVPWLQKATYSIYGNDLIPSVFSPHANTKVDCEKPSSKARFSEATKEDGNTLKYTKSVTGNRRPKLMGRHSFAGHASYSAEKWNEDALGTPTPLKGRHSRRKSSSGEFRKPRKHMREDEIMADVCDYNTVPLSGTFQQLHRNQSCGPSSGELPGSAPGLGAGPASGPPSPTAVVFPTARALEVEPEPLIKRTGVVKLFGRTTPVALTREYADDPMQDVSSDASAAIHKHKDIIQRTPRSETPGVPPKGPIPSHRSTPLSLSLASAHERRGIPKSTLLDREYHLIPFDPSPPSQKYEEYEQTPPSPWSQSPAPSPAPLLKPDVNPFFVETYNEVNEDAFASSPPPHDYSETVPLEAIGIDRAKTVIHIPLIHSASSRQGRSDTLRFPVAVISLLAPIIPYPANLRNSLALLLPHLTTSFCLAQQYSQLEKQSTSPTIERYGHLLGLGGTFSDANSELELINGLSGHVNYASPLTQLSGGDAAGEGYFRSKSPSSTENNSSSIAAATSAMANHSVQSTPTEGLAIAIPQSQQKNAYDELTSRDPGLVHTPSIAEAPAKASQNTPQMLAEFSRHSSTGSFTAQWHREAPSRPFPDTVAQLMLNSIPLHLFLAKPHTGEVIWTNAKFDAYRRSQPMEPRVRDPWQNVHSSEYEKVLKHWTKALRTGSQFTERVRVKRFNDESEYRWFIFRANPLISGAGELLYWIGSFLDVHEQHVAERKAAQEREMFATDVKYRALANSIPQVVFEAAEYSGLISVNEQWELYTGQSLDEAMTLGFAKYIHRDDLEKCGILSPPQVIPESNDIPEFARIMSNGNLAETLLEAEKCRRNSTQASSSSSPQQQQYDNPLRVFGKGVTPALQELVRREIVTIQRDENGRDSYTTEIRFRSRKGDFRWHLVRLVKVETPDFGSGEASWYGTCTDINDRKLLERELNTALQKLNREMESKTKFFSNMSHEIRTPLNGILGTIPFVLDTLLDNDQRRMLDTIQNSSTNLRELVDNILDVSKVEAGKMNIVRQWFHVRSVLEDAIDTISSRAIDKGLELNYLVDADVPATVLGDRFRIRQILINLMGNAVKFTTQGEICTRCSILIDPSIKTQPSEILLNFEVVDTGKGFNSTDAERLMQRFSQIETNGSQQHAGSGLGLFLSKQLVEMHGGRLTPTSKEGRGAKFSFYVMAGAPSQQSSEETATPSTPGQVMEIQGGEQLSRPPTAPVSTGEEKRLPIAKPKSEYYTSTAAPPTLYSRMKPVEPFDPDQAYNTVLVCPFDYAREAIKQHIEQVTPYEVQAKITCLLDIEDWRDLRVNNPEPLTHIVLGLPEPDEVIEILSAFLNVDPKGPPPPTIAIIADIYLKRSISNVYKELLALGRSIFIVPKPVKPSVFSLIFDPGCKRELSKDRNQDMAREVNNSFKNMSKIVKEVIGNKGYRVLLVEDDETNRTVMLKYLDKVKLVSETAGNGQECVDMVFSKEPGYYSLIICDIQMPVKNGYDTCREIRSWESHNHFPQIPIMALSANAMVDQIDDAAHAGFNDYVTKPIKHNELGKMMMELLDPSSPRVLLKDRKS
ncbi:peroxide stress-activated histidine kinase mak1 [Nannizzia gypsea CBS 118893]|uniref:histidine kinase n=1 Tax=Arthroderma gypseum (strain ATCC MYA-4604 / CBS 118893) TaxID=535722 RepID=E5R2U6_ARTGP|nr:peroxide stress-activated histidine kinase mak1 [Nannizzia gypsea CBS 118893]EFQ97867.1 peroxide stress-activated histidine kinase mak1 [Nannizzia gypsea CBS 118893]